MRTDVLRPMSAVLLLVLAPLSLGCAPLKQPLRQGSARGLSAPRLLSSPSEAKAPERRLPRGGPVEGATPVGSDASEREARRSALAAQLALRGAILTESDSTRRISAELARLKASGQGLASANDVFLRYADYATAQLRWIDAQLAAATRLTHAASRVENPDMQLALLRMAGPRMEAAMMGSLLLSVWLDFLHLADVALRQHLSSVESLFADMWRWQEMLEPSMRALSSQEHEQMEAAAQDVPSLVGHLAGEFSTTVEHMRGGAENLQKVWVLKEAIETVTTLSTLRFSLPSVPPSAPVLVGIRLVAGGDGVMMGTRVVVSAEWVDRVRQLVRTGILSLPVVSAAVRIQAGQAMLTRAHGELPRGVRDALGEGPEVGAMHVTDRAGAGMDRPPRHHVMPEEFREWFEKRGFTGEMDIDEFCITLERAHHEALHGGGDWKLGRTWPGEWNRMIMEALRKAESRTGRMLTPGEILGTVAKAMEDYHLPMRFISWRRP